MGAGPVGRPSLLDEAVAVVGPVAPGRDAGGPLVERAPASLRAWPRASAYTRHGGQLRGLNSGAMRGLAEVPEPLGAFADAELGLVLPVADLPPLPRGSAGATGPRLIERISGLLAGLVPRRREPARTDSAALDDVALAEMSAAPAPAPAGPRGEEAVEAADLSSPLGLGVIVVAAAHYGRRIVARMERRKARIVAHIGSPTPPGPRRPTA